MNTTRIEQLFRGDEGVSPVIGVILMVAVTVILAAVIGAFVMGMGDNLSKSAPQANFQFEHDGGAESIVVTHAGGDSITDANTKSLVVQVDGSDDVWVNDAGSGAGSYPIAAGDSITVKNATASGLVDDDSDGNTGVESGDEIRVVWTADNGQSSQTIAQYTA